MNRSNAAAVSLAITVLMLIAACAGPSTTTLPDGRTAFRIDCSAGVGGLNFCFEKAGKSCGAEGYTIVGEDGATISSSSATETERAARLRAYQLNSNSILVVCGT